jgi:hypothetical protein
MFKNIIIVLIYHHHKPLDHIQNYWGFGLCSLPGILLQTRKHDVSETGSVSKTLCFLVPRIPDDGQNKKIQ